MLDAGNSFVRTGWRPAMSDTETCQLTTKDYTILEAMLERYPCSDETTTAILRRKVSEATVMFRDDIPPTVVTLSSRVVYRVNDGPFETRIVAHDEMRGPVGMLLPITNRRGLALLGLDEGQSITIPKVDGSLESLTVQQVVYQPEAARRERMKLAHGAAALELPRPHGPVLRVTHRSDGLPDKSANRVMATHETGFDDPGPSAA
jgi:regulator of nucleoside diphosphate kinase